VLTQPFNVTDSAPAFFFVEAFYVVCFTVVNGFYTRVAPDFSMLLNSHAEIVVFTGFKTGVESVNRVEYVASYEKIHRLKPIDSAGRVAWAAFFPDLIPAFLNPGGLFRYARRTAEALDRVVIDVWQD